MRIFTLTAENANEILSKCFEKISFYSRQIIDIQLFSVLIDQILHSLSIALETHAYKMRLASHARI